MATRAAPELGDPVGGTPLPERRLPLSYLLGVVRRFWWLIAVVFTVVVSVTIWRTLKLPRLYRAMTTVRIQEPNQPLSGMNPGFRDYRVNPMATEQTIIRSDAVAGRVVDTLGLQFRLSSTPPVDVPALFGGTRPRANVGDDYMVYQLRLDPASYTLTEGSTVLGTAPYGTPIVSEKFSLILPVRPPQAPSRVTIEVIPREDAVARVRGGLGTEPITETNIIQISYLGTDPREVQAIANATARAYADFSSEARRAQNRARTQFIQQQVDSAERRLIAAQNALRGFKQREQLSDVQSEMTSLGQSISRFEADRQAALVEQRVYQSLMGSLASADTVTEDLRRLAATDAVQKNPYIAKLYDRWFDLMKSREELLSQRRGEEYNDVVSVNRLITRTKEDLRVASELYLQGLQTRLQTVEGTIARLRGQTVRYPTLEAEQSRLQGDVRTMQLVYDQLLQELQRARILESSDEGFVRVIDEARLPTSPVAPNRTRIALAAALVGLVLGIGAAFLLDHFDDSIRSPDEIRTMAGITVLGTIPRINVPVRGAGSLVTHLDPRSPVAESYRSLRTNLAFARASHELRTIIMTSPGPADGKSTTVANLAITFAQQGNRTLIIDGDLRRAVLDKLFDVPRAPGVTDVITGQRRLEDVVSETRIPNLFVLGSGPFPPNPSELLGSTAMRDLIHQASSRYDFVLIDTPPLLAVTDAAVLSTMADGVIVVVRMASTARTALRRALSQLEAVSGRLIGTVLNDVDMRRGGYYYSNYGYYYYYYHHDGDKNGRHRGVIGRVREWMKSPARR